MSRFNDIVGAARKIVVLSEQAGMSNDEFAKSVSIICYNCVDG
jgi:hypothetical protein